MGSRTFMASVDGFSVTSKEKLSVDDILGRLSTARMNAKEISDLLGVSISTGQKRVRALIDDGLAVVAYLKRQTFCGKFVPYYRATTAEERTAFATGDFDPRAVDPPVHDKDESPSAFLPQRDSMVMAFFGTKAKQPI